MHIIINEWFCFILYFEDLEFDWGWVLARQLLYHLTHSHSTVMVFTVISIHTPIGYDHVHPLFYLKSYGELRTLLCPFNTIHSQYSSVSLHYGGGLFYGILSSLLILKDSTSVHI
jgi:hypothetical protein